MTVSREGNKRVANSLHVWTRVYRAALSGEGSREIS